MCSLSAFYLLWRFKAALEAQTRHPRCFRGTPLTVLIRALEHNDIAKFACAVMVAVT